MILVYSQISSQRFEYIIQEISDRINYNIRITNNKQEFAFSDGFKINYSNVHFDNTINVIPVNLLFENNIEEQNITVNPDEFWKFTFFGNDQKDVPFDLFAASFYLLSRYEEYLPHIKDEHGRYDHMQSLAYRNNFIEMPLVDIWAQQLKIKIIEKFPQAKFIENQFKFISTIDIDFVYKYKSIGAGRQFLKLGKSLLQLRLNDAAEQLKVLTDTSKDPFDTYDLIEQISDQYNTETKYFILMKTGTEYDKNILTDHPNFINLITRLGNKYAVGLHPSYYSENNIDKEKILLEKYSNKGITDTRQHFLKLTLPQTYQELLSNNFTDDYSMAYSGICGFRASTCFPFSFFDLSKNESASLTIHPTIVMDVTLKNAQQLSPENAIDKIRQLMNDVKKVNGTFINLWHNSSLCEDNEWKGWKTVFEQIHRLATTPYN